MEIDPKTLERVERYKLLIGGVVPRPIAFVSTCSADDQSNTNLAPYSFFNAVSAEPMVLMFCPANKDDGSEKDTLRNCKPAREGGVGEFVVNIASEPYRRAVAGAAEPLAHGDSEFDLVGLTQTPSKIVGPPRVLESPMSFECRTLDVMRLAEGKPGGGNIVLGEVVWVHAGDDVVDDRMRVDADALGAIGRMGGSAYSTTKDRFEMPPGRRALEG